MASYEVCLVDKIRATDRLVGETKVRNGDAARFLRVVCKVCLSIFVGVVADDFDAVFIRADRAVRTESVEFARNGAVVRSVDFFGYRKRMEGHVVGDADCETSLLFAVHICVDSVDHRRIEFLATDTVTSAKNFFLDAPFS